MKIWLRCNRTIGHVIKILINVIVYISGRLQGISFDEQTVDAKNSLSSQNLNSKNNSFGQCHTHQRLKNMPGSQTIDVYYKFFTIDRFKLLAMMIVLISACYHVVLHLRNGHNTCNWLLTDGRYQGYNEWQPHGCMMHKYTKRDSRNCMNYISYWGGRNYFVFVGDSRIRQLYYEFVGLLSKEPVKTVKTNGKLTYSDAKSNVLVEFLWTPYVDDLMKGILESWINSESTPRLIVIGSAMWTIKLNNGSEDVIPSFKSNVTGMNSIFSKYKESTDVVWMLQDHVVEARLFPNKSMITNKQIDLYNRATIESLISSKAQIWSSSVLIGQGFLGRNFIPSKKDETPDVKISSLVTTASNSLKKYDLTHKPLPDGDEDDHDEEQSGDGLHLPREVLGWDVQVLLNMICNNYMNFDDGSCCTSPENPTPLQMVLALFFATSLFLAISMTLCKHLASLSRKVNTMKRNRTILNGFSHFVPLNKNLMNKDSGAKDDLRERAPCNLIHEMTSQVIRSSERCICESEIHCDIHHKDEQTYDGLKMSSAFIHMNSDILHQNRTKQEFNVKSIDMINCEGRQFKNTQCHDENIVENELTNQCEHQDASCVLHYALSSNPNSSYGSQPTSEENQAINFYSFVCCISKLGIILSYFFICDRTTFFMKENKYYTHVNFFLPFTYLMVLGLFFTEKTAQMQVLNRNQTDEWKGWMQIVILIYHLTGASKVLSIYMQIRVMVSTYLFMSAYGHFIYFFNKNDFSLHRLCTVIFRFNFLVALLCLAMNRPYQFYYFVPLVTFWFVIIFLIMASPPRISSLNGDSRLLTYWWLISKIIVLIICVTILYSSEVLFDKIFLSYFLKPLFVSSDESIHDWRFRWSVDRYSSTYGLVFSVILIFMKKIQTVDDSKGGNLSSSKFVTLASIFICSCGLVCYAVFTSLCQNKDQCNETHSYIAFIPILCYIVLRNMLGCVRKKFSAFFAWFGKISLELFIAQYHVWLAADTHGILVLIPTYPVLNLIVTSFVFVCVAHELKKITNFLIPLLVPSNKFSLLRNILLVLVFTIIRHFLPF